MPAESMDELDEFEKKYDVVEMKKKLPQAPQSNIFDQTPNGGDYTYIARLFLKPVADGRHRLLWRVLAPYAVNIIGLDRDTAIDMIDQYLLSCECLNPTEAVDKVPYYVDHAITTGLKPPHMETLASIDPDLAEIISGALV